jgi:hypothetical protein
MRRVDLDTEVPGDDQAVMEPLAADLEAAGVAEREVGIDLAAVDGPAVALELARRFGRGRHEDSLARPVARAW